MVCSDDVSFFLTCFIACDLVAGDPLPAVEAKWAAIRRARAERDVIALESAEPGPQRGE